MTGLAEYETVEALIIPGCQSNSGGYGCCSDAVTPASGPNQAGCPSKLDKKYFSVKRTRLRFLHITKQVFRSRITFSIVNYELQQTWALKFKV